MKTAPVWTLTVDPAARWSDGTGITAQQVVDSWQVQAAPLNSVGRIRTYLGNVVGFADAREMAAEDAMTVDVSGLSALDDSTVQVELVLPDPIMFWRIATAHMAIARAEDVLEHGFNEFWKPENNPIVNGPFILTSFDADQQTAEMTPNPEWWKEGPILEKVTFLFVTDQQIVGTMALNDQIDASLAAAPSVLRPQMPDYFRPFQAIGFNTFWMQPTREPTSDPKVREALIKSVDWSAVFQAAFPIEGSGVQTTQTLDDIVTCQNTDATGLSLRYRRRASRPRRIELWQRREYAEVARNAARQQRVQQSRIASRHRILAPEPGHRECGIPAGSQQLRR